MLRLRSHISHCLSAAYRGRRALATAGSAIEIEAKFPFTEADVQRISVRGRRKGTKIFTDRYWDKAHNYPLTTCDMWLRQRDKTWELKVPLSTWRREKSEGSSSIDQYKELAGEGDIQAFLFERSLLPRPSLSSSLEHSLSSSGFAEFAKITTHRVIYECDGLTVTFDTAIPLNYTVGELELLVAASADVGKAEESIRSFAKSYGLRIDSRLPGKVLEHIRRNAPLHWKALRESGHLKSKNVHEY